MRIAKICLVVLCILVGLAAAGTGAYLALEHWGDLPVFLQKPQEAEDLAREMLDAVKDGRYEEAQGMFLGSVDLGMEREADDAMSCALWQVYRDKLEFIPEGELYATEAGVARDYIVRYLEPEVFLAPLESRAKIIMEYRIESATCMDEIYDRSNGFRQDLVEDVVDAAFRQLLEQENIPVKERNFTVELVYSDGQWKILPREDLLMAITAGLTD